MQHDRLLAFVLAVALISSPAFADAKFDEGIFQSHMVLQRDKEVAIWGRGKPKEKITVTFGEIQVSTEVANDGRWRVKLAPMRGGAGRELTVTGSEEGSKSVTLTNVAVGEVWICSGQSNMTLDVGASRNGKEEGAGNSPEIRFLDHIGWKPCTPKTTMGCSAVAYYFARKIQPEVGVPVGLILRAQSMSAIQPWTPVESLHLVPELKDEYTRNARRYLDHVQNWLARSEKSFAENAPIDRVGESDITQAGSLWRSHIAGFRGMAIRGFLWYQGESNTRDGVFYAKRMQGLVQSWRQQWDDDDLPFYFVQIAPFDADGDLPGLWEGQLQAARTLPHTDVAQSNDIGYSIHPDNKQAIGQRLALIALKKTYGKDIPVYQGPRYKSLDVEGDRIRIRFEHAGSGLVSRDGKPLTFFEIAGAAGEYVPAEAQIDGDAVVVSSKEVSKPVNVRFAWRRDAVHNLSNKEGLPAYPFRTDTTATKQAERH